MLGNFFIFQQDSSEMIGFVHCETPAFIGPELWPTNSPDLNPVDYWTCLPERVYQSPIQDVDSLKQQLISVWAGRVSSIRPLIIGGQG